MQLVEALQRTASAAQLVHTSLHACCLPVCVPACLLQIDAKPSLPHGEHSSPKSKKIFVGGLAPETTEGKDARSSSGSSGSNGAGSSEQGVVVCVNGLLPGVGSVSEVVAAAEALVAAGATVLKVKVGRR